MEEKTFIQLPPGIVFKNEANRKCCEAQWTNTCPDNCEKCLIYKEKMEDQNENYQSKL